MQDNLKLTGEVTYTIRNINGTIKKSTNMVVLNGKVYVAKLMSGDTTTLCDKMAAGSGSTQVSAGDSQLVSEYIGGTNVRPSITAITRNTNIVSFTTTFIPGNCTGSITELGLFHGTELIARTTFSSENKGVDDYLDVVWNITIN